MTDDTNTICPECKGEKKIPGTCVCDMEWRGSQEDEDWVDCHCIEEEICPLCHGSGYISGF